MFPNDFLEKTSCSLRAEVCGRQDMNSVLVSGITEGISVQNQIFIYIQYYLTRNSKLKVYKKQKFEHFCRSNTGCEMFESPETTANFMKKSLVFYLHISLVCSLVFLEFTLISFKA